jgi:hypothetical protein
MNDLTPELILPFILYAEIHYKFKGIYSRLIKNEPEIIADAPFRVEPGQPIPVLLLIKDAHRFPIHILEVIIEISSENHVHYKKLFPLNLTLGEDRFWFKVFHIDPVQDIFGFVDINVRISIKVNGKTRMYRNDNYRISSHQPLQIYLAKDPLPQFENWHFGDFHYHSNYTEDQVEFGAPLDATVEMARAIGLSFFAVTDHSYDLDDHEDSWMNNDHRIPKWHRLLQEVEQLNANLSDFVILPGEEVSAGNHQNRNVHLLILNNRKFFPGKGDSAERWFRTEPDLSIEQILDQLNDQALAIAGHPEIATPALQWLLIRRGHWQWQDFQHVRLDGFQIWNGEEDRSFRYGSDSWVKLLLEGKKLSLIAGNDAHGNFNRFRQIGFPFFTFRENNSQIFGNMRTGVQVNKDLSINSLIQAVKCNRVLVSNGPIVELSIRNEQGRIGYIGEEMQGNQLFFSIKAKSTEEFGKLELIRLYRGDLIAKKESLKIIQHFNTSYKFELEKKLTQLSKPTYLRAEVVAKKTTGQRTRCMSNPIWIN